MKMNMLSRCKLGNIVDFYKNQFSCENKGNYFGFKLNVINNRDESKLWISNGENDDIYIYIYDWVLG